MNKTLTDLSIIKKHFEISDPKILGVLKTINISDWFEERPSDDHFQNLVHNIIFQQLAGKAASTIYGRFDRLLGGQISPDNVVKFSDQQYRDVGLSWAKAKYVRDLASKVISAEVVLDQIDNLDNEEVILELTKVKGIGRWTAEMFLLFTLRRENIFSYGDLGLKNGLSKLYGLEYPSLDQIKMIVDRWAPFESYGSISLWHHLDNR